MAQNEPIVLYEDNHLLALYKPAGLATMGVAEGRESLITWAKDDIKRRYDKPGNVYLGVVSRLDAPVTGVVLIARTSKAAARLNELFRSRQVKKEYLALVQGRINPPEDECVNYLAEDPRHRKMWAVGPTVEGAKKARLRYRMIDFRDRVSLLQIELLTGRKHQIRVQLADRHFPIIGDRKYGSRQSWPAGIALHSYRLLIEHPIRHEPLEIIAPLPESWANLGFSVDIDGQK
jgi:23S rRNA pseudouridine1911/1915/1917 synthase